MKKRILLPRMDPLVVNREISDFIIKQIASIGMTGGVIGLSGGVDSTTTAAIAKSGFDRYNAMNETERTANYGAIDPAQELELKGYLLPSKLNSKEDEDDGRRVAERLGIRCELVDLECVVHAHALTNPEAFESGFHKGNMISRIRANVLNTKAATERKLLIGTGNRDEDFGVGYYTLFGDGAVHLSPIGMLPKRLVREMAVFLGFKDLAYRESSPGLEAGQTAFKDLGYRYETIVELVSYGLEQGLTENELIRNEQVVREAERQIAEYGKTFGRKKFVNYEDMVRDVIRRNGVARAKGEILHPPIAKVTLDFE